MNPSSLLFQENLWMLDILDLFHCKTVTMMRIEQPTYSAEKLCHSRLLCDLEDSLKEFDQNDLGGRAVKGCALGWGERPSLPSAGPATM